MSESKRRTPKWDQRRGPARQRRTTQPRPTSARGGLAGRLAEALLCGFGGEDPGGRFGVAWKDGTFRVLYGRTGGAPHRFWPLLRRGDSPADEWGLAARFL